MPSPSKKASTHIISVDIGTTTIRACIFDAVSCAMIDSVPDQVPTTYSGDRAEICPDELYSLFLHVVTKAYDKLIAVCPEARPVLCFCTQRNSFLTYDIETLRPTSKIICWNDQRSKEECEKRNRSVSLKMLHLVGAVAHFFTRMPRFKAARMLQFIRSMVSFRLMVTIQEDKVNQQLQSDGHLGYACLDTWLLLKLSKGEYNATEPSNVSATGMYDPFLQQYNSIILGLIGFPSKMLVPIVDSATTGRPHCVVEKGAIAHHVPEMAVHAVLADQQAALFGCAGVNRGDTMISMGTGTFLQKNLAGKPHASMNGLYPLVGWRLDEETTFIAEGQQHHSSVIIQWAKDMGLFDDVTQTSAIAESVSSSNGVVFVPAMGGLQTCYNDDRASCTLFGLKPDTTKAHQVRAILESLAFRVSQIYSTMEKEIVSKTKHSIRVCGGISNNDFVCQTIATLINRPVERIDYSSFAAARGVALMAGISLGAWKKEDVSKMVSIERTFVPKSLDRPSLLNDFSIWQKAVERSLRFE